MGARDRGHAAQDNAPFARGSGLARMCAALQCVAMNRDARTEADLTGRGRTLFADPGIWLFVTASFAAACLIFLVQPMVGKRVLPWFGGAPAVWALCLAFYQTVLFAG